MRALGPDLPIPASAAVEHGKIVYTSGQVPIGPDGSIPEGITAQTDLVLDMIEGLLKEAGSGLDQVIKTTVFLTRPEDFAAFNAAYAQRFGGLQPARSTVIAGLLPPVLVEIEAIAAC